MEPFLFKQVPSYFSCLGGCCNTVLKLQKCFVDYETLTEFPSAWEWVDSDSFWGGFVECEGNRTFTNMMLLTQNAQAVQSCGFICELNVSSVLFLRWLVRGTCTSLCVTQRHSSPWLSLTTRGPTWRWTPTVCRGWTTTLCPSLTTTKALPTCWTSGSSVWQACPSLTATATNQRRVATHTTHLHAKHSQSLSTPTLKSRAGTAELLARKTWRSTPSWPSLLLPGKPS